MATSRKLGITHLAFYRGWLNGLPLRQLADAYLETGLDLRRARTTLRWIQDELRRAALRHGHYGQARLLRLRIRDSRAPATEQAPEPQSIDDFREEFDPAGFYTFDELMLHFRERYPAVDDRRAAKRARLLQRQLAALNWIEGLLVTHPVVADPVEAWFDPTIAIRLRNGGIATLFDLMGLIAGRGYRWYRKIPQLGEIRAKRILKWVKAYSDTLGELPEYASILPRALTPDLTRRQPVALPFSGASETQPSDEELLPPIVPLEAALLPRAPAPDAGQSIGVHGASASGPGISAGNDREAIEAWLNAKATGKATFRAYRKESERLLLWAVCERGLTLRDMQVEDCAAYRDWLCQLGRVDDDAWSFNLPQETWFAPRYTKRYSPAWRPFEGALSPRSVRYALTVCRSLFKWLTQVRYLPFDPWPAVAAPRVDSDAAPDLELTRVLSREEWDETLRTIDRIDDDMQRLRTRLLFRLALVTGMRLAELADARYDRVYARPLRKTGQLRWMLKVHGKGDKWRSVPLTEDVTRLLSEYLRRRKLPDDPRNVPSPTWIFMRLDGTAPLTATAVTKIVKQVFVTTAERMENAGRQDEAKLFAHASTHWIRHTTGALLGDSGTPLPQIQQLLGHASIATTTIYTRTNEDELFRSVNKVMGGGN